LSVEMSTQCAIETNEPGILVPETIAKF